MSNVSVYICCIGGRGEIWTRERLSPLLALQASALGPGLFKNLKHGGESEIWTHERIAPLLALQASALDHSATLPALKLYL